MADGGHFGFDDSRIVAKIMDKIMEKLNIGLLVRINAKESVKCWFFYLAVLLL